MRICIITEGSYPYVYGGVSTWTHRLIQSMEEHEFVLYTIGAEEKQKGIFKYHLPSNVNEVQEVFLDQFSDTAGRWGSSYSLQKAEREAIQALIVGRREIDWLAIFNLFHSNPAISVNDFLMSKDFFDIVHDVGTQYFSLLPFTDLFWTVRSMLLPLIQVIRHPLPQADLYHSVATGYAGVVASLGKCYYQKPFILSEHGIYSREREEEIIKANWVHDLFKDIWIEFFYTLSLCAYQNADKVITLYNGNKQIEMELHCPAEKIVVAPNGVSENKVRQHVSKGTSDCLFIGAIVRVVPIKDIKTMLQSFAIIKEELPEAKFLIMGSYEEDIQYYNECLQMLEILELCDVEFLGQVNVNDYMNWMDVLVLTSISEAQPLAVLEGMAAGKPFVTTNVGSCKELLYGNDDGIGRAGIVTPIMNAEAIAEAVITLCKNKNMRLQMGENGIKRVQNHYLENKQLTTYKKMYQYYGVQG